VLQSAPTKKSYMLRFYAAFDTKQYSHWENHTLTIINDIGTFFTQGPRLVFKLNGRNAKHNAFEDLCWI
jgi:hypothetical protein